MSAELLREAANELRATVIGAAPGTTSDPDFKLAVADWLEETHINLSTYNATTANSRHAFAVARAYLGDSA